MRKKKPIVPKVYAATISRYSLTGKLLETYKNAKLAAEKMNGNHQHISKASREDSGLHTAYGYVWRRGTAPEIDLEALLKKKWMPHSPLARKQHTIGQYDFKGNLVNTYLDTKAAGRAVGVHYQGIRKVTNGRGLSYGGFIWSKVIKKQIPVNPRITEIKFGISQYDLDGKWLRSFKTGLEATKITGIGNDNISIAIKGTTLTAGGYLWRKGQALRIPMSEIKNHPCFKGSEVEAHIKAKRKEHQQKIEQQPETVTDSNTN